MLEKRVHKLTLKPGWKWSTDVKPHLETETCQATHLGVINKRNYLLQA